jgi:putative transposase
MARLPRLTLEAQLHLVVQRGNNGAPIFHDDADRASYLEMLQGSAQGCGLAVHAYALLANQVHLLATTQRADSLSQTMQTLGRRYVAAFNRRHGRSGTLWEGRFRATVVESERYFLDALLYVELAPERAGVAAAAADWNWSSIAHHLGRRRDPLVSDHAMFWRLGNTPFEREAAYRQRLERGLPAAEVQRFADAQLKGWALGSEAFLQMLAQLTSRPLAPRPRGRPRKVATA